MRQQYAESTVDLEPGMNQRFVGSKRFADAPRIRTIDFARSGIEGTGSLSPRSRRTLAVYIVLVKMGYCGISAPMGAIADAVFRSSHGEAGSIRTLQRSNRELEDKGYIRSVQFRPGKRSRGAVIYFQLDAFAFWTQRSFRNVAPMPTHEHISPDATSCHPPDRTKDQVASNSQDLPKNEHTKPHAGARAIKKSSRPKKNPVLFSVDKAIEKMVGRTHRADRTSARARARCEVAALAAGVALVNPSGVDWEYWASRWQNLSVAVREATASREIVPLLFGISADPVKSSESDKLDSVEVEDRETESPTVEEIRDVRKRLEEKFSLPAIDRSPATVSHDKMDYPEVDESDPDMRILLQARARARARVDGG